MKQRALSLCLLLALAMTLSLPAAFALTTQDNSLSVSAFAKNIPPGGVLAFSPDDFKVSGQGNAELDSIVLTSLPKAGAGLLRLGDAELRVGDCVSMNAVEGMKFCPLFAPVENTAMFTFVPVFSDGVAGPETAVSVYLLAEENTAPAAEDLQLNTYKNVAAESTFKAVDPEGDALTFQLVKKPARGQVEISEDGSGTFVYTPYENKTGKDTFTYVAVDSVGNTSPEATVKVTISKAKTKVTYADLDGNPAHKAAIRLAEEGVLVGAQIDGAYYFQPDLPVSRDQFLVMAMSAAGEKALAGVSATGFSDDAEIPSWAKGYVSAALMSGAIQGISRDGQVCFSPAASVTRAEAAVVLDRLIRPEAADVSAPASVPAWASQSVANLRSASVLADTSDMGEGLTRGEAAQMLCAVLEYRDGQKTGWFGK